MTLTLTSQWEHDIYGANEGASHLVVTITAAESASGTRASIDLAFALDRSGSMQGPNKLDLVKRAVIAAVEQMKETDRVSLVTFDNEVETRHALTVVDGENRRHLEQVTNAIQAGGSTNLSGGWLEACRQLSQPTEGAPRIRRTLLLTDGLANNGITDSRELARHARELRDRGISTSAIGVGDGFDEFLLSGMAESGGGNFQYIADAAQLEAFFSTELRSLAEMVAVNPYLELTLPRGMRAELINAFPSEAHRRHTSVDLRDLAGGEQVQLVFVVTSRRAREEAITPELHLHWAKARTGAVEEINESGDTIAVGDAANATRNDDAAATVALELAARDHREAVKLDRAGNFRGSRDLFFQSVNRLQQAPDTDEVRDELVVSYYRARMSPKVAMSEHERKSSVHDAHRRSRGGRRHEEAEPRADRPSPVSEAEPRHEPVHQAGEENRSEDTRRELFRRAREVARGEGQRHVGEHRAQGPRGEFFRHAGEEARGEGQRHWGGQQRRHGLTEEQFLRMQENLEGIGVQRARRHRHKGGPRHDHTRRNV